MTGLTYAIGDIHGHAGTLAHLLRLIDGHAGRRGMTPRIVFLGDYIDRGPDSAGVLALVRAEVERGRAVALRGNHEEVLRQAQHDDLAYLRWLRMGGDAALRSFGAARVSEIPADMLAFVASLPTHHEDALRFFVHAGVDPDRGLHDQNDQDLMWIRGRFLAEDLTYEKFVVHGHTPQTDGRPDLRRGRVNLDTAVEQTGLLTAAVFDDRQARPLGFLQARDEGSHQLIAG